MYTYSRPTERATFLARSRVNIVTRTPTGRFHAVVLDAGRETCGFVDLEVEAAGGEIIDLFHCEHVKDSGDAIVRAQNGGLCHMADRYRCRQGRQRHQFFSWKGFRSISFPAQR